MSLRLTTTVCDDQQMNIVAPGRCATASGLGPPRGNWLVGASPEGYTVDPLYNRHSGTYLVCYTYRVFCDSDFIYMHSNPSGPTELVCYIYIHMSMS